MTARSFIVLLVFLVVGCYMAQKSIDTAYGQNVIEHDISSIYGVAIPTNVPTNMVLLWNGGSWTGVTMTSVYTNLLASIVRDDVTNTVLTNYFTPTFQVVHSNSLTMYASNVVMTGNVFRIRDIVSGAYRPLLLSNGVLAVGLTNQ